MAVSQTQSSVLFEAMLAGEETHFKLKVAFRNY